LDKQLLIRLYHENKQLMEKQLMDEKKQLMEKQLMEEKKTLQGMQ
jgi:hypothetical protein